MFLHSPPTAEPVTTLNLAKHYSTPWICQLLEAIELAKSGERGEIIARAQFINSQNSYPLVYTNGNGSQTRQWWGEDELDHDSVRGTGLPERRHPFAFELGARVALVDSGEKGKVIGRAEYATAEDQYLLRYVTSVGQLAEAWWDESAIVSAAGVS